ncbi:MAG: hypothetical protein KF713_04170 [Turneriella sp.]|nr:hypothetical protein [Turneriella sp.]
MRAGFLLFLCFVTIGGSLAASPTNQPGHFGIGGIIGEPTGASIKYVIDDRFAVQGALGLSIIEKGFWIGGDFLLQFRNAFTADGRWPLYLGGGIVIQDRGNRGKTTKGDASLGVRAVAGVEFLATEKLTIFGEVSMQPFLIPSIDFGLGLGVGARYWL